MKRILSFFVIVALIICTCGCSEESVENGAEGFSQISEQYVEESTICNIEIEDIILSENLVLETTYNDNQIYETKVADDIIAESYVFEISVLSYEMDYILNQLPTEVLEYDVDWESVIEEFAIGTVVIVTVGVMTILSTGTSLCYFFASAFFDVIKESLVGAVVGAVVNALSKSENFLDFKYNAKKYLIEGASEGYMWGAISALAFETVKSFETSIPRAVYTQDEVLYGIVDYDARIYDTDNQFMGYLLGTDQNTYVIDTTDNVIGMLDDSARITDNVEPLCVGNISKINKHGRYSSKFKVDGNRVISGNEEVGTLNKITGEILTKDGQLLGRIDSNYDLRVNNFRAIKKGVQFDREGKIISAVIPNEVPDFIKGATKVGDYLDAEGNYVAYSMKYICGDRAERYFLMSVDDNSVLGILEDSLQIATDWNAQMSQLSANGVKKAKETIIDMVTNGIDFDYGPSFTDDILYYIKENGKMPEGVLQGHHINNVAQYPWLADSPDNIVFYTKEDHLNFGHNGNFQNTSQGELTGISKYMKEE